MNTPQHLILVVAVALVDADGRVLLAQRPEGKAMAGLWEFPGGKIETGVRPEEALIRELREELGIAVKEACLAPFTFASHTSDAFHLLMPLYVCRRWDGTPQPRHHAGVLVLDLNMPGEPSLSAIPAILESSPETAIVVLTMQNETAFAR